MADHHDHIEMDGPFAAGWLWALVAAVVTAALARWFGAPMTGTVVLSLGVFVVLAADEPDHQILVVAFFVFVAPGQHALDAVAVDGDVVLLVADGGHDRQLHLRIRRLVLQHVDQFAHSHVSPFRGWVG